MPFRNTTASEAALKLKITHDDLPTIFQEVIRVTYLLGIRYIWADALCIVQDSKDDWERESHKMFAIYRNAYVTISALDSVSVRDSMFSRRSVTVESESSGALPRAVVVSQFIGHRQLSDLDEGMLARHPLFRRAWSYQERLLSTRILHCAKEEWIFECCTFTNCECGSKRDRQYGSHPLASIDDLDENFWWKIVSGFSRRALTYATDSLPAMASLAIYLQSRKDHAGRCVAGLWRDRIPEGLVWYLEKPVDERPKEYIAPTWSWASLRPAKTDLSACTGRWLRTADTFSRVFS